MEQLVPIRHGKFVLSASGLSVDDVPTLDEWAEVGHVLAVMDRGLAFLIGDWIRLGEDLYGEVAAQVIDARHWRPETIRVYTWLAEKVPVQNRMLDQGLTVAHHQVVAALPEAVQRHWLEQAMGNGHGSAWPVARLKTAIKQGSDAPPQGWYLVVRCETERDRDRLALRLTGEGFVCKESR